MSLTVTVKAQLEELPDPSVTLHVTVVVPFGNVEPDDGEHAGAPTPEQLSLTAGAEKLTAALHCPVAVPVTIFAGQVILGGCVSFTVTVNEQEAELDEASDTEHVTVVVPFGKLEPEAGAHTGVPTPEQLSVAVGVAKLTTAEHWPLSLAAVTFAGHVITGA